MFKNILPNKTNWAKNILLKQGHFIIYVYHCKKKKKKKKEIQNKKHYELYSPFTDEIDIKPCVHQQ